MAYLAQKTKKEEEYFNVEDETQEEDEEVYENIGLYGEVKDEPYFHEDRPPTPKLVKLAAGINTATQVEDGELFDFNLEVEPILEVLVGRTLVQAKYELIEDDERRDYLQHKRKYEQQREFELINLQRMEAARIRKEEEKIRRRKQTEEKKIKDYIAHKKLLCKTFAKAQLKFLNRNTINHLTETGFLKIESEKLLNLQRYIEVDIRSLANSRHVQTTSIENIVERKIVPNITKNPLKTHHEIVTSHKEAIRKQKEDEETKKRVNNINESLDG